MNIMKTAEVLYRVRELCTSIELLFPGKWWINFLKKVGFSTFKTRIYRDWNFKKAFTLGKVYGN